jgi:zinc protease
MIFGAVMARTQDPAPVARGDREDRRIVRRRPAHREEMERTRVSFINQSEKALANHESLGVQLSEYIALGDWRLFFLARDDIAKITAEQVAAASSRYFQARQPHRGPLPARGQPRRAEIPRPRRWRK